jgi:hypothetical protein
VVVHGPNRSSPDSLVLLQSLVPHNTCLARMEMVACTGAPVSTETCSVGPDEYAEVSLIAYGMWPFDYCRWA